KSRLVGELRATAHDCAALTITIEAYERATPYAAIYQLLHAVLDIGVDTDPDEKLGRLRAYVDVVAPELEPWTPLRARVLDPGMADTPQPAALAPQNRPARTADVLVEFLCACWHAPTLVTLDDTEWLDDASREVLEVLARSVGNSCALV